MSRKITTEVYQYDELSNEAKAKAREWFRNSVGAEYVWGDDAIASLKGFARHFGATLKDWSIDWSCAGRNSCKFGNVRDIDKNEEEDMIRLKERIKELRTDGGCQFTGYCADDDCNDGAIAAWKTGEWRLDVILQAGFESWIAAAVKDYEWQNGDEQVAENISSNEYEFTFDGKRV